MSTTVGTLDLVNGTPGLADYLEAVEERLATTIESHPGLTAAVGTDALAAGGKRLRPALAYLSAPEDVSPPIAAGVAVELVHQATLVHDDLIDGARVRRGRAAVWTAHGADAARAAGDYLFSRAFSELAAPDTRKALPFCLVTSFTARATEEVGTSTITSTLSTSYHWRAMLEPTSGLFW